MLHGVSTIGLFTLVKVNPSLGNPVLVTAMSEYALLMAGGGTSRVEQFRDLVIPHFGKILGPGFISLMSRLATSPSASAANIAPLLAGAGWAALSGFVVTALGSRGLGVPDYVGSNSTI